VLHCLRGVHGMFEGCTGCTDRRDHGMAWEDVRKDASICDCDGSAPFEIEGSRIVVVGCTDGSKRTEYVRFSPVVAFGFRAMCNTGRC